MVLDRLTLSRRVRGHGRSHLQGSLGASGLPVPPVQHPPSPLPSQGSLSASLLRHLWPRTSSTFPLTTLFPRLRDASHCLSNQRQRGQACSVQPGHAQWLPGKDRWSQAGRTFCTIPTPYDSGRKTYLHCESEGSECKGAVGGVRDPLYHRAPLVRIFQGTCSAHKTHSLRPPTATTTTVGSHGNRFPAHLLHGLHAWHISSQARPLRFFPRSLQLGCTQRFCCSVHLHCTDSCRQAWMVKSSHLPPLSREGKKC